MLLGGADVEVTELKDPCPRWSDMPPAAGSWTKATVRGSKTLQNVHPGASSVDLLQNGSLEGGEHAVYAQL